MSLIQFSIFCLINNIYGLKYLTQKFLYFLADDHAFRGRDGGSSAGSGSSKTVQAKAVGAPGQQQTLPAPKYCAH